jgi:hypothetical protein
MILCIFRIGGVMIIVLASSVVVYIFYPSWGGRRGRDRMVVGFTTTCAISAYHH